MPRSGYNWIQTYTGKQFFPLDMREEDIDIVDIAHALSMNCRYSGHCLKYYSVAEHSYIVSLNVPPEFALEGLLHDASEAFFVDMPRPIKPLFPEYVKKEKELEELISSKYNLIYPLPDEVKEIDNRMLKTEYDQNLFHGEHQWTFFGDAIKNQPLFYWSPEEAKENFLERFYELYESRN